MRLTAVKLKEQTARIIPADLGVRPKRNELRVIGHLESNAVSQRVEHGSSFTVEHYDIRQQMREISTM